MEKVYTQKEVRHLVRRYDSYDDAAGKTIHALAKGRQRETGESYSDALHAIMREPPTSQARREVDPADRRMAGIELDGVAKGIRRSRVVTFRNGNVQSGRINYQEALNLAIISNPILGSQYTGHEILPDAEAFALVRKVYGERVHARRGLSHGAPGSR